MRTHNNGELRIKNVGENVVLAGWVAKKRNLGGLIFVDLRDRQGITQIVVKPENKNYSTLENVKNEYVIQVTGKVVERESKNKNIPTGEIEVDCAEIVVLSEAEPTPMIIADETDALEDVRMKYRYLDLRRPVMQKNLILRHNITKAVRSYFDAKGFISNIDNLKKLSGNVNIKAHTYNLGFVKSLLSKEISRNVRIPNGIYVDGAFKFTGNRYAANFIAKEGKGK